MGKYVQDNLVKDENVVYETKLHWIVFISLRALITLFIAPMITYATSEFAITNKRVIIKVGLIGRTTLEMNLQKIETVNIDQGILGRMLGYGTVTIVGSGGTKESFPQIASPLEFRKRFQELS